MPNIKETIQIIENTPVDQAIMLEAIHGVGKSEVVCGHFAKKGYRTVTLFLGQLADAGDVLGLPDRMEIDGIKRTVFCPPAWWPTDDADAKVLLFLDEINRAKPELQQVIMDLVLNRKLHGRELPKNTKIVAARNPVADGHYQVEEMDPALEDRFNIYQFKPDGEEWIDWASRSKVNKFVIDFIFKNQRFLDPPSGKDAVAGTIYPSRRSWKRVSDLINNNPEIVKDDNLLGNTLFGIIGIAAASAFCKHIREVGQGISASSILTGWKKELEEKVRKADITDQVSINKNLILFLQDNENMLKKEEKIASTWAYNLQLYLETVSAEAMADLFDHMMRAHNGGRKWPGRLMQLNNKISTRFIDTLNGKDKTTF